MAEANKQKVYQFMVEQTQRQVLKGLIRQLQQYMMSINSGTTDNSMWNSDNLDSLSHLVGQSKISTSDAVAALCEQAKCILQPSTGSGDASHFATLTPQSVSKALSQV